MKQMTVVILCIALCILCLFPLSAAAMDAGPVTTSQGETVTVSDISPGGITGQHTVTGTPTQPIVPPASPLPAPLQGNISGIPVVMLGGFLLIALALIGFGYWYIFKK
jgi:hypothetical protein